MILAALLAGMRGDGTIKRTRRWVSSGAWLAIVASGLTFWLSKTLIQSLARYGEKLEAVISILAVVILLMVTNWVFPQVLLGGLECQAALAFQGLAEERFRIIGNGSRFWAWAF